jgi:hypothetical protein
MLLEVPLQIKSETGFRAEVHGLVCSAVLGYSALQAYQLL